uniref:WAP domain-containing protein n=1 Tax=Ornithorhynchus anatinus TaxID=9258 RepID=A0A6I8PGI0_ORNAN
MKSSGLFPLAVILALGTLQVSWAQKASQRPGTCPPDNIRCIQAEADQCQDDSNCPGNQKCCHYQCGMKCKDPQGTTDSQKVKAVQDPLVTVWPGITDGKKGQSKDVVKKGSCPVVNIRCAMLNPPNHCLKDSECPAEKKCCEGACGKACVTPENTPADVVKKGSCPVVNIRCAMLNPPNRCLKDSECPAEKKCCEGACGKACVTPENSSQRPGTCPPDNIRCKQAEADQCKDDSKCPGNQKCCHYQCGMKCRDPQGTKDSQKVKAVQDPLVTVWPGVKDGKKGQSKDVVKKGSCPVVNIRCAMLNPPNRCLTDSECPAEKKCCEGGCGKDCVTPEKN